MLIQKIKMTSNAKKYLITILLGFAVTVSLFAQNAELEAGIDNAKKDVALLHEQIYSYLEKLQINSKDHHEIQMGIGSNTSLGGQNRYVYLEKAILDVSGSSLSKIEFFYVQRGEKSLAISEVRFINENPSDKDLGKLRLEFKSTGEKDVKYNFADVSELYKYKIIIGYREKLDSLVRALGVFYENSLSQQEAGLDSILSVGKEKLK